jgi:NAD(P)-dependent dehydrogenase (short-subunit alcohol dehydrogenase family)
MLGRICVVALAGEGVGREIARGIALKRATVIVAARDARAVAEEISDDTANPAVSFVDVDVASARSIAAFADAVRAKHASVHVLVNAVTDVVAAFRVASAMRTMLEAGAPSRIVNVAPRDASGDDMRLLTWALADRLRAKRVTANAVHPGVGGDGARGAIARAWHAVAGVPPERAAVGAVWLASSRALDDDTGEYYVERRTVHSPHEEPAVEKLWARCEGAA